MEDVSKNYAAVFYFFNLFNRLPLLIRIWPLKHKVLKSIKVSLWYIFSCVKDVFWLRESGSADFPGWQVHANQE